MKRLDLTIILGLLVGLVAVIGAAMLEGITARFLWQPTAALVVLGGTGGAVIVRRGLGGLSSAARAVLALCLRDTGEDLEGTVERLAWISRAARREGVKIFERYAEQTRDPLVASALALTAEYADPSTVRAKLERILDEEHEAGLRDAATLDAAGGFAPTFGILGAVLGLIHVLRLLDQPGALGVGIATAFVATIYGVGVANLAFFPLAARLKYRHEEHMKRREILAEALVALAAKETPAAISRQYGEGSTKVARTSSTPVVTNSL